MALKGLNAKLKAPELSGCSSQHGGQLSANCADSIYGVKHSKSANTVATVT